MAARTKLRRRQDLLIQIIAGAGLVLLGTSLFLLLRTSSSAAAPSSNEEESVVPVPVSYAAPELTLKDLGGATGSLASYRGRVLLVNNWATWCPPCKAEMPTLEAFYEAHRADGLTIVAIEAGESRAQVAPFVQSYGLTFPVWLDPQNASLKAFRNGNLPNSYVIDRGGTVRYAWTGAISRNMLETYVTPLIAQSD